MKRIELSLAETRLAVTKAFLEEARAHLREAPFEEKILQQSYRPMNDPKGTGLVFNLDLQGPAFADYLDAYERYLIALMERDRLRRELNQAPPGYQPAPTDRLPGPTGVGSTPGGRPPPGPGRGANTTSPRIAPTPKVMPARKAIRQALNEAARHQTQGNDREADRLLDAALSAGVERLRKSTAHLDEDPTLENLQIALAELEIVQRLGGSPQDEKAAFNSLRGAAGSNEEKAVQAFRKTCSKQNLEKRLQLLGLVLQLGGEKPIRLPPGVQRLRPAGPYVVGEGESLSRIAEKFYGQQNVWDVIYLENVGVIGRNPDRILTGVTLQIP